MLEVPRELCKMTALIELDPKFRMLIITHKHMLDCMSYMYM